MASKTERKRDCEVLMLPPLGSSGHRLMNVKGRIGVTMFICVRVNTVCPKGVSRIHVEMHTEVSLPSKAYVKCQGHMTFLVPIHR